MANFRKQALTAMTMAVAAGQECDVVTGSIDAGPPLSVYTGWGVILGFGLFFTIFTMTLTYYEVKVYGTTMSSEYFNTAGRNVGAGLTAAVIVSQWTWAATLLMSSNMGWRVGIAGPFWYASGATIQILLFAILAIQVKRRASHMHTFMEIIKARFGTWPHCIMMCFALAANCIVTAMLLLGGSATIEDLTGVPKMWASFLIPILSCWIYTMYGGLRATFFASYVHTSVIFLMLAIFTFTVYAGGGDCSGLYGSPGAVFDALTSASEQGYLHSTRPECEWTGDCARTETRQFSGIGFVMQNAGLCYNADGATEKACTYTKLDKDANCCSSEAIAALPADGMYCKKDDHCIDASATEHYQTEDCAAGETCVTSFITMKSVSGILFGITNIVGNFGTVFVDQSYWQSAVAAKPKSAVMGFLIGGMVWFAVPFCMATTNGLAGRALTTHPQLSDLYIDVNSSGSGLTPARVLAQTLGSGGAFLLLLQLFMAITSTGSAEIIAVSSIITYDVYYTYLNPELKHHREGLRSIFYSCVGDVELFELSKIQELLHMLYDRGFFDKSLSEKETINLIAALNGATALDDTIEIKDLYDALNRSVSSNSIEGPILLRVSKAFTLVYALFMGFLSVFLQQLGFGLGWVYMSMGVIIGSAVGPASLSILLETANGKFIALGAVGGLVLGVFFWFLQAAVEFGEVTIDTLGKDMPFVAGNVAAIMGGLLIALLGSLAQPDKEFKWHMLNDRIPLVDDIEPPKDDDESGARLLRQVKIAYLASLTLTFVLIILWPLPMHFGGGVFSQGGFTFWVILEMVWAVSGGIVIIVLPAYETIRDMRESRKQLMMATSERRLRNGNTISCEFVEKTEKQRLVDRHLLPAPGAAPKNEEAVAV
jgi:Na+/proline symporter